MAKTSVRIPMAGLDQGVDPKLAQGLLLLENSRQDRKSEFVKRNGLYPLAGSYTDGNLAIHKGRPILFGPSGIYALSAFGTSFDKVADAAFFDVDIADIGTGGNASVVCIQVLETDHLLVVAYVRQNNVSGSPTYHLATYDKDSLRLLDSTTSVWKTRVFEHASTIVYVTQDTVSSKMAWGTISDTTGAIGSLNTCTGSTNTLFTGTFDVCPLSSGDNFAIVHTEDPGGGTPELIVVTSFGGTPGYNVRAMSASTAHALAVWEATTGTIAVAAAYTVVQEVRLSTWDETATLIDSEVTEWGWSAADDCCEDVCGLATSASAGRLFMTLGTTQTTDTEDYGERVITNTYTGAGTTLAAGTATDPFQEGCRLVTKPFTDSSGVIYVAMQRQGDFLDGINKCYFVCNSNGLVVARFLMDKAVLNMSLKPGWLPDVTDLTDSWRFGVAKLSGYETSHVAAVTLEKLGTGLQAVEAHGLLVLPGANPWVFDGTNAVEMGFLSFPMAITAEPRESWDILNDLAVQYAAHIQLPAAPTNYHPNGAAGTNDIITATAPCTTQAEAILLANDIKAKLVAHAARTIPTGHGAAHVITVSAADATDYDSLITLVDELVLEYEAHRVLTTGTVHGVADVTNDVTETYDGTLDEATVGRGYQGFYEHYMGDGKVERSAPSPVVSVANIADETMSVVFPELHQTAKGTVHFCLYRTEANKATLKRVQLQANDVTAYEGTMTDSDSDENIEEEPQIYTTGNVLSNLPPPPTRAMWVHQERLFVVNREAESWDVRYSKPFEEGEGIAFNNVLALKCTAAGGRITAGASLLGRIVLFKGSSIYTSYGTGYSNTGTGSGYSAPELVSAAIGCVDPKTLVETPIGLMFLSEDGIYLLDQQWGVSAIGKPVKTHTDVINIKGVAHVKDRHYVIWVSDGVALVYDYLYNTWSTFTDYAGTDVVVDEDNKTWVKGSTTVLSYEDRTLWTDGSVSPTAIKHRVRTGWIAADAYQKVHDIGIMGQNRSDCTIRVKIAFDFQMNSAGGPYWAYDVTLNTNLLGYSETSEYYQAPGTLANAEDALLIKVRIARRCRAFLVEISDETRSGGSTVTKGFTVSALDLSVSPKGGLFRTGGARQAL